MGSRRDRPGGTAPLMGEIVSSVSQIEGGFLINEWENVMDAHRSRLLGDGYFGHPR